MRVFLDTPYEVYRLTQASNKSSYGTTASSSGYGFFKPLTDEQAAMNGFQVGQGFVLIVENAADIVVTDKVKINSVDYLVKGVGEYSLGPVPYKRVLLTKDIKS